MRRNITRDRLDGKVSRQSCFRPYIIVRSVIGPAGRVAGRRAEYCRSKGIASAYSILCVLTFACRGTLVPTDRADNEPNRRQYVTSWPDPRRAWREGQIGLTGFARLCVANSQAIPDRPSLLLQLCPGACAQGCQAPRPRKSLGLLWTAHALGRASMVAVDQVQIEH